MTRLIPFLSIVLLLAGGCVQQPAALTDAEKQQYVEKGKGLAQASFAALSGRLAEAIEQGGVPYAAPFCSVTALPLLDSLSKANNAVIRRTSLKVRNSANQPAPWEKEILLQYEAQSQKGEALKPVVKAINLNEVAFAAPISVLPLCVKCHGKVGETMDAADYEAIKKTYPADQAFGYAEGDLRGMWSIVFKRE